MEGVRRGPQYAAHSYYPGRPKERGSGTHPGVEFEECSQEEARVDRGLMAPRKHFIFSTSPRQTPFVHSKLRAILKPKRTGQAFPCMVRRRFSSAQIQDGELRVNDSDMQDH